MSAGAVTSVGPYRLDGLIGRGGMGEVYRAFDTRRQRMIALKLLPAALAQDTTYRERFRRESLTAAALTSPHVVPIHDFGEVANRLFIDMRLINGVDLASHLSGGPFDPTRAVEVIRQASDALGDAHRHGVVHRDIKPSNILLTDSDFVYLVDFGIAQTTGGTSLTETGTTVGTFGYMAPERLNGTATDARADVYSLACVLHELLVGQRPYAQHTSTPSLIRAHLLDPPPVPSQINPAVPEGFDRVVARGMAKEPEDRYSTIAELVGDLDRLAAARPTAPAADRDHLVSFAAGDTARDSVAPASPAPASSAGTKRRATSRLLLTALAGALLVAIGAVVALWLQSASTERDPSSEAGEPSTAAPIEVPASTTTTKTTAGAATRYTLRLTGTARAATITFNVDGSSGSASEAPLPWSRDLEANTGRSSHLAQLSAFTPSGDPGNITCVVTDQTGRVVDTQTAASQGGQFGSAMVNCSGK